MEESVHHISKSFKDSLVGVLSLLGLFTVGFSVFVWQTPEIQQFPLLWLMIVFYLFVGSLLLAGVVILKQTDYYIVAGAAGLTRISKSRRPLYVGWSDIARTEDRPWHRCLRLFGVGDRFLMDLDWQLEDFEKLHNLVRENISHTKNTLPDIRQIYITNRRYGVHGFGVAMFLYFCTLSMIQHAYLPGIVFAAGSVASGHFLLSTIRRITSRPEGIELWSLMSPQSISWRDIYKIELTAMTDRFGESYSVVCLQLKTGQTVELPSVKEGNLLLHEELNQHFNSNK